jgi:hypothetical protein
MQPYVPRTTSVQFCHIKAPDPFGEDDPMAGFEAGPALDRQRGRQAVQAPNQAMCGVLLRETLRAG